MEWIDVTAKNPPQGATVILAKYDAREKVKMHFIYMGFRIGKTYYSDFDSKGDATEICSKHGYVTHWMPIPDPPSM